MSDDWKDDEYLRRLDGFFHGNESTTLLYELKQRGWRPPNLDEISPDDISRELTNLIWSLKDLQVYITDGDHLNDQELYEQLLEFCNEPTFSVAGIEGASQHWSPIGGYSEEDCIIHLIYYADDDDRERWLKDFPESAPLPDRMPIPYPRPWIPKSPLG